MRAYVHWHLHNKHKRSIYKPGPYLTHQSSSYQLELPWIRTQHIIDIIPSNLHDAFQIPRADISTAGGHRAESFTASSVLHTNRMCFQLLRRISGVAVINKNQSKTCCNADNACMRSESLGSRCGGFTNKQTNKKRVLLSTSGSDKKLGRQRPGTVSWVLLDRPGSHYPLSPVIKLGIRHPRKKERFVTVVLHTVTHCNCFRPF